MPHKPTHCRTCNRPLKTGFMAAGKFVSWMACKSPVCKDYGKKQA